MVHDAVYSYCWWYMMLYTAAVDGTWCCIQLLLMVHDAVYSYCWWYMMLYTATADGTWCCIQLLLMVHDAVYSYCWWYMMLYTATVDGTWCCIQLLLMVHDAVYSYCWWYMMLYTATVDSTCTKRYVLNKISIYQYDAGSSDWIESYTGAKWVGAPPPPPFPLRTETVPGSETSHAAHITTVCLHSNTQ